MKKIILLAAFIFCVFSSLKAQDCSAYHTGYFKYTDSAGTAILIHRKKKYQYEYDRVKKIRTQFRVQWIDNCTYTITQAITNSKAKRKSKNSVTKVTMNLADDKNGYYATCSCLDDTNKTNRLVTKITKQEFYQLY